MVWVIWLSLRQAKEQTRPIWFKNFRIGQSLSNQIESDDRFEFESNLEASQVPRKYVQHTWPSFLGHGQAAVEWLVFPSTGFGLSCMLSLCCSDWQTSSLLFKLLLYQQLIVNIPERTCVVDSLLMTVSADILHGWIPTNTLTVYTPCPGNTLHSIIRPLSGTSSYSDGTVRFTRFFVYNDNRISHFFFGELKFDK